MRLCFRIPWFLQGFLRLFRVRVPSAAPRPSLQRLGFLRLHLLSGLHSDQPSARLVDGLLVLFVRIARFDDAGAGLEPHLVVARDDGADRNCDVHVAVEPDVAHGAAVDAPAFGLELFDDLHGPNFGRAAQRARREGGSQHVEGVTTGR